MEFYRCDAPAAVTVYPIGSITPELSPDNFPFALRTRRERRKKKGSRQKPEAIVRKKLLFSVL